MRLTITDNMCAITRKVIKDFNALTDEEFLYKYHCKKSTYYKRVLKYKDPYMNAPLAKFGKFLAKHMK